MNRFYSLNRPMRVRATDRNIRPFMFLSQLFIWDVSQMWLIFFTAIMPLNRSAFIKER